MAKSKSLFLISSALLVSSMSFGDTTPINTQFVKIPHGSFQMGSPTTEVDRGADEVLHKVTISHDFEMQETHVTQSQWLQIMGTNPSSSNSDDACTGEFTTVNGISLCPNNPVDTVSYDDVQKFITKLNQADDEYTYRLPTEAEWEYAARAGTTTAYYFGDDATQLGNNGWFNETSDDHSHPVKGKTANAFGLYDMAGNLFQWTQDLYGDYATTALTDPKGAATGTTRVIRGGGWHTSAHACRSANRFQVDLTDADFGLGFRLVRTVRLDSR